MASPKAPGKPGKLYFVNAPVDFLCIGGLSILTYFLLPKIGQGARTPQIIASAAALSWVVNWPHFSATLFRLYHTSENTSQYPVTSWVIPPVIITAVLASFSSPAQIAPLFVKVFLLWSPYHFSGQTLGITLLYARRGGFTFSSMQRWLLEGFIYGTFLVNTARGEASLGIDHYYSIAIPALGLPLWVPRSLEFGLYACAAAFVLLTATEYLRSRRMPPIIALLPAVAQWFWFVIGSYVPGFYEYVPFFHSLQYLLIAWAMQLKEKMVEDSIRPSSAYAWSETARWSATNFVGGVFLFWALPRMGARAGYDLYFAMPVLIAAVQIHHFFVDGVIWKLRNPKVAGTLMTNIDEFLAPARA